MGFKEAFERYKERKREEKEQLREMETELRLKKRLEQKMKTPAEKEYEFYLREEKKNNLDRLLKQKRKEREKKLQNLSNPFNKHQLFKEKMDLKDGDLLGFRGGNFNAIK